MRSVIIVEPPTPPHQTTFILFSRILSDFPTQNLFVRNCVQLPAPHSFASSFSFGPFSCSFTYLIAGRLWFPFVSVPMPLNCQLFDCQRRANQMTMMKEIKEKETRKKKETQVFYCADDGEMNSESLLLLSCQCIYLLCQNNLKWWKERKKNKEIT